MFVFTLEVSAGGGGAVQKTSINKHFYTTSHVYDRRRQPAFFIICNHHYVSSRPTDCRFSKRYFPGSHGLPHGLIREKKKKTKNLKRFIMRPPCPGLTHLSFFFFPEQIELLEVDISRERKGCFLLQLECAISRKPGVSIALRPKGGKANKKRGAGGRVEDKELDGDGLLMDSTVPQCQFPFLIGGLFLKTNRGETDFFLYRILANSDTFILSRLF